MINFHTKIKHRAKISSLTSEIYLNNGKISYLQNKYNIFLNLAFKIFLCLNCLYFEKDKIIF